MSENKVVLITGASGGIGKAIIPVLLEKGYTLALQADTKTDDLIQWISTNNFKNCKVFKQHLHDEKSCFQLLDQVVNEFGAVQYLLNNAGINFAASAHKMSELDWNKVMNTNLNVPFYLSKAVVPLMIEQKFGRIIHMSSVVASLPIPGTVAYAASKAALRGMAKAQAADWAKYGITVNCIAPGYLDKGMIEEVPASILAKIKEQIPTKQLGTASNVAELANFLFSENSAYINGETINMNGGLQ